MVEFINLEINKKDILYDSKVKMTRNNQGVIRIKDKQFKNFTYVIFPIHRRNVGSRVEMAVDEILNKKPYIEEDKHQIDINRKYVGRRCIVISSDFPINLELRKRDVISDRKVVTTWNGQGIVRLKDSYLGNRSYVIFPFTRIDTEDSIILSVSEILNKGVHSNNDHTCRVLLGKNYIDDECLIVLQEG